MKKICSILFLIVMALSVCACGESGDTENQGVGQAGSEISTHSNLGNYNVIIESCRLANNYSGEPIVIVKYKFTNNDSEPASFMWSVDDNVYQNGIELNHSYFVEDSANFSSDNQTKEIKKGVSIYVEAAYELDNTMDDIEVEISQLFSLNNKKIQKIFSIKQ